MFPPEFDYMLYANNNDDLGLTECEDLLNHWLTKGLNEGRSANQIKSRSNFIDLINKYSNILEIGPFVNPLIVNSNVKYADVLNRNELIERAQNGGRKFDYVPEIDYVLNDLNLHVIEEKFDSVVSSHCIEHQPDLIRHLQGVEHLLDTSGFYFIIIPDKRYCFDRYLPLTTLADVIDSYYCKKIKHSLRDIIFHRAFTTHNNSNIHWESQLENFDNSAQNFLPVDTAKIKNAIKEWTENQDRYIDVHSMFFTPNSFGTIINTLNAMGLINLKIERMYPTNKNSLEFYAILSKASVL